MKRDKNIYLCSNEKSGLPLMDSHFISLERNHLSRKEFNLNLTVNEIYLVL